MKKFQKKKNLIKKRKSRHILVSFLRSAKILEKILFYFKQISVEFVLSTTFMRENSISKNVHLRKLSWDDFLKIIFLGLFLLCWLNLNV